MTDVALLQRWWNGAPLDEYEWFKTDDILSSVGQFAYGSLTLFAPVVTGAPEPGTNGTLRAIPNPATADVVVEIPGAWNGPYTYSLLDPAGSIVRNGTAMTAGPHARLDVADLPDGNYLLRLLSSEASWCVRVVVLH